MGTLVSAAVAAVLIAGVGLDSVTLPPRSHPDGVSPYRDPHFKCGKWLRYRFDRAPEFPPPPRDPFCVEYDKRNITVDNGGAVTFLRLEPFRFAAAAEKCFYWQKDHWWVQVSRPGEPVLVRWDGSYWLDRKRGEGGGIFRNFRVADHPSDAATVAALVERVSPDLGALIRSFGARGGGGGAAGHFGNPSERC